MADEFQLELIRDRGVQAWNAWRREERQRTVGTPEREARVDLRGADLADLDLAGADLSYANGGTPRC